MTVAAIARRSLTGELPVGLAGFLEQRDELGLGSGGTRYIE
jgi:hypothetical protein